MCNDIVVCVDKNKFIKILVIKLSEKLMIKKYSTTTFFS